MTIHELIHWATDKTRFKDIDDYSNFSQEYLNFINDGGLQAIIVAKNENNYRFFQYREDGEHNVTRPINFNLLVLFDEFANAKNLFYYALSNIHDGDIDEFNRININKFIYTCQQLIGVTLDALPAGWGNKARKINGDLFEKYIKIILRKIGIFVRSGEEDIPVIINGESVTLMKYQHDLIIENNNIIKAIGSVKTSSKDRLDKIFLDKYMYNHLRNINLPHFAIFLNDVQRQGRLPRFGINSTFLSGHFKGYSIALNPMNGVYYCDLRPNMRSDQFLSTQINSIDKFLVEDVWKLL